MHQKNNGGYPDPNIYDIDNDEGGAVFDCLLSFTSKDANIEIVSCILGGHDCKAALLEKELPDAEVSYSVEYEDEPSRDRGNAESAKGLKSQRSESMDFDIREIREYYDSETRDYDFNDLVNLGISVENADFMINIGVPKEFGDFTFYDFPNFGKIVIKEGEFIKVGHCAPNEYGLYLKEGSDELFTSSSLHDPFIYTLNQNLRTFFLFHLIRQELSMEMKKEGVFTSYDYAVELRKVYEQIDPIAMEEVEGYWSHLIEDYETGLWNPMNCVIESRVIL